MNKPIYQTLVITSLLACTGLAQAANKFDYVNVAKDDGINIGDGKIFINPTNGNYGTASKTTVPYHLKVKSGCNGQNMLKSIFVSLGSENVSKEVIEYSDNFRVSVNANLQKTLPWTSIVMHIPMAKLGFNPATLCQNNLHQKISQGASKQQVMATDQVLSKGVWFTAVASCGKLGKTNDNHGSTFTGAEMKIICKAGSVAGINNLQTQTPQPNPGPGAFQAQTQVTDLAFNATPYQLSTTCPARAKFTGSITTSGPGTVQYRVLFPGSAKTSVRSLKFDTAGTRSIGVAEYETDSSIPYASATLEILAPFNKKAHTNFKVNCITAGGPGSVNMAPAKNATPAAKAIKAAPVVPAAKISHIKANPTTPLLKLETNQVETKPVVRRLTDSSREQETREETREESR